MADKIALELVSPDRLLESTEADMVVVPGSDGDFGVLPGHVPLISTLRPGVIEIYDGTSVRQRLMVTGGFAEVTGQRCTILVEEAMPFGEVNVQTLEERLKTAQQAVADADNAAERETAEKQVVVAQSLRRAYDFYANR